MKRFLPLLLAGVLAMFALAGPAAAARPAPGGTSSVPINYSDATGSFVGQFDINSFAVQGGDLVAIGDLTGTVYDAEGAVVGTVDQALTLDVIDAGGSCEILDLTLGPLDLNLLGLMVHLDTVHLNITAEQGPGNLLGNLLCAVAGLLDQNGGLSGALQGIATLLNQILAILG